MTAWRTFTARIGRTIAAACVATVCAAATAQQYTSQILNPPGSTVSRAWGAYNGRQIGHGGGTSIQTAALWSGTPGSAIPLAPAGWSQSFGLGINSSQQVGTASGSASGFAFHAVMWMGTAASLVDLNPPNYDHSAAYATDGTYQVGQAASNGIIHAMRWTGTPGSAVDLNPAGFDSSHGYGAWNGKQVGIGSIGGVDHALLWSGTAASAIDLNGAFDATDAYAMDGVYQVGSGAGASTGGASHALRWSGTAASVFDLHPAGFNDSAAEGVGAGVIAGSGSGPSTNFHQHALAWVGSNVVDLHTFLPAGYTSSVAHGVDPITGQIVGEAVNSLNRTIAFMWTPVPEPATLAMLAVASILVSRRRR